MFILQLHVSRWYHGCRHFFPIPIHIFLVSSEVWDSNQEFNIWEEYKQPIVAGLCQYHWYMLNQFLAIILSFWQQTFYLVKHTTLICKCHLSEMVKIAPKEKLQMPQLQMPWFQFFCCCCCHAHLFHYLWMGRQSNQKLSPTADSTQQLKDAPT